ncbi:methyltransferase domain-containing protein [Pedobacter frigoris]|uniref:Methyltransferase domain-containing protein n=1 Tax=Pedobacter frigoris TaxID=2571272 RepID=A0A4V6WN65_9SPHI|nr:methyltransferase domain-containing protein [Pedobacter frigoris]TKC09142.1 methyltransferase domain-containing protein [Pedobacter frigoris]
MPIDTRYRSDAPEIMDDFEMEGEILRDALDKIASINRLLGGNKVTLQGVKWLLKDHSPGAEISILDVGCGNGDMLRALADYAAENGLRFNLVGIDANKFTIKHAGNLSAEYPNISYVCVDIFDEFKQPLSYDVILCTLTLHHFKDPEIMELLEGFKVQASKGIVINDLHRSAVAYYLFTALCFVFGLNKMSKEDGLISILRGFKRKDLLSYSRELGLEKYRIKWKWAFRYQWLIKTL